MPKLERSEWYDLCRDMNWHFKYVTEAEVFPEVLSQSHGPLGVRFNPSPSIFDEGIDYRGLDIAEGQPPLAEPETEICDLN
jgi:hypothetical protein